jgi:hypothetical protein
LRNIEHVLFNGVRVKPQEYHGERPE